ncbi:MAG: D-glycero-beta-D-manno-heptose 1-phosphate adenylyltransferase [Bacteroidales bacterium]|nr:D-glycero-beta-D-manno-heptose 1-phosphate adenylyltransferase [Bacteroidales bacterium]
MNTQQQLQSKIFSPHQWENFSLKLAEWRGRGLRIAFTNGCFDILHAGHADYLAKAADLADVLIVGLNTDASVRRIKGSNRPVNNQDSRSAVLASLFYVDAVVLFDEDDPANLINFVMPGVLIKGADYNADEVVGADVVRANQGEVVNLPLLEGYSTTRIIEKIKKM